MAVHGLPVDHSPAYETVTQTKRLCALDLVASGAQDRDQEAVLEIALVPIVNWEPDLTAGFSSRINPVRMIAQRPWIAPGLTDADLREAPSLADVLPELANRINGSYMAGYNIGSSWRLLRQLAPGLLRPAGLIDVLRLARTIDPGHRNNLSSVIEQLGLDAEVARLATDSRPGRALWDCVAASALMTSIARPAFGLDVSIAHLLTVAGVPAQRPRHLSASDWRNDLAPARKL